MNTALVYPSDPVASFEARLRRLLHEWFVVYNPLYFASALSFLAGVWLGPAEIAELARLDWRLADLALLGIVQCYEIALIGGAMILWRAGAYRPATMLLLLESIFFFDPTGEIALLTHLEPWDLPLAVGWLMFATVKIQTLSETFDLRLDRRTWVVLLGFATEIVASPLLFDSFPRAAGVLHPLILFLSLGLAATAWSGTCRVEKRATGEPLGKTGSSCFKFVIGSAALLSFFHWISWLYIFDIELGRLHGVALYLFVIFWLAFKKHVALCLALALIPVFLLLATLLIRFEQADLADALIGSAFLLIAAGLAINLSFGRGARFTGS